MASGIGVASLAGDRFGTVREVPVLVAVGDTVRPGLAAEVVRVAEGAESYIIAGRARVAEPASSVGIGSVTLGLPRDGTLRFRPSNAGEWGARTVSARDVLAGRIVPGTFAGRIVLIGGTAPELGTLRPTAASPVTPGVQINADAIAAMLSGTAPLRPDFAPMIEAVARALLTMAGLLLGWRLPPGRSVGIAGVTGGLWVAGCLALLHGQHWLIDPVSPPVVLITATLISATMTAVVARRKASAVLARFRQHVAPEIVDRIVRQPNLSRVEGERRVVTFLFTDIEGFTAMSAALSPETVVALLDGYFQGVTGIITGAGGTVDKYVGDAVHAMFNAPNDLDDHATRAIRAAHQINRFTEGFRLRPDVAALGLRRTRIGIETGEVIVGDVGGGARRDYTAHGTAINTAARLEALNARLGTAICVGPVARAAAVELRFVSHGVHELKGLGSIEVFEPLAD
jgi:adenylate cyclase